MDDLKKTFLSSLKEAVRKAGSQTELAKSAGMQQSRISDYLSERYDFDNITVGTLRKIFPELQILYFIEQPHDEVESEMEKQVVEHFRNLTSAEKAKYMMVVAAHFPNQIKQETKRS